MVVVPKASTVFLESLGRAHDQGAKICFSEKPRAAESKEPQRWGAEALGYATRLPYMRKKPAGTNSTPALYKLRAVRCYGFTEVIGENVAHAWQSTSEQW